MKTTSEILKSFNTPILTYYYQFSGFRSLYVKVFCAIDNLHPLYGNKKYQNFVLNTDKFYKISGNGFIDLRTKNDVEFYKNIQFLKVNKDQFEEYQMKNLLFNNYQKYFWYSCICNSEDKKIILLQFYKIMKKYC